MKMTIKGSLRAAIVTGAIGFLPTVALADEFEPRGGETAGRVPDHAEAEEPTAGSRTVVETPGVPDHAEAEEAGARASTIPAHGINVPDHAEAEEASARRM